MTVEAIFVSEGTPATYPDPPAGLSAEAAALDPVMVWQRLESYIAHRYSEREMEWIVEGCGDWRPPLKPATITNVEAWTGEAWEATTLLPAPIGGYQLPGIGPYRFTGTAGVDGADVPAIVLEAFRRLAEYMAAAKADTAPPGARSFSEAVPDVASTTVERSATWQAMALQASGAADVLRPYRRA